MSEADGLRARLTREGWAFEARGNGGRFEAWKKPGHGVSIVVPTVEELSDYQQIVQQSHQLLDQIAVAALPLPLKLAAPDLLEALADLLECFDPAAVAADSRTPEAMRDYAVMQAERAIAKAKGEQP